MKNSYGCILVKPQLGENIGATARVLKNFGFNKLCITSPRDGWPNQKAKATSVGASNIIEKTKVFDRIKVPTMTDNKTHDSQGIHPRQQDNVKVNTFLHYSSRSFQYLHISQNVRVHQSLTQTECWSGTLFEIWIVKLSKPFNKNLTGSSFLNF